MLKTKKRYEEDPYKKIISFLSTGMPGTTKQENVHKSDNILFWTALKDC